MTAGVVAAMTCIACGTSSNSTSPGDDGGAPSADGADETVLSDGGARTDSPQFNPADAAGSDGGASCASSSPDATGCPCMVGASRSCYTGPPATRGVGACHDGMQACVAKGEFGTYGPCTGDGLPGPETCSSTTDTNCNGSIGCADPVACPGGCMEAGMEAEASTEAGPTCPPPDAAGRCPLGTVLGFAPGLGVSGCCPCTAFDCPSTQLGGNTGCCAAPVCAGTPGCGTCTGGDLQPACGGRADQDCDDFPEDCDQLCCPCKPSVCKTCTKPGYEYCGSKCIDVLSNDNACGSCDYSCFPPQHCVMGICQ
jgi:hypothetical protein